MQIEHTLAVNGETPVTVPSKREAEADNIPGSCFIGWHNFSWGSGGRGHAC